MKLITALFETRMRGGLQGIPGARMERLRQSYRRRLSDAIEDVFNRACQDGEGKLDTVKLNAMLAVIDSTRPENELQAMLAVQMALTHSMALDLLRRTQWVDQIPQVDSAGSLAIKLLRTFTMQVEALAKLQRGGEQVVKVVHVHAGGQAIVGTVQAGTGVGGGANEN